MLIHLMGGARHNDRDSHSILLRESSFWPGFHFYVYFSIQRSGVSDDSQTQIPGKTFLVARIQIEWKQNQLFDCLYQWIKWIRCWTRCVWRFFFSPCEITRTKTFVNCTADVGVGRLHLRSPARTKSLQLGNKQQRKEFSSACVCWWHACNATATTHPAPLVASNNLSVFGAISLAKDKEELTNTNGNVPADHSHASKMVFVARTTRNHWPTWRRPVPMFPWRWLWSGDCLISSIQCMLHLFQITTDR